MRQKEVEAQLRDPQSDYFLDPADYGGEGSAEYAEAIHQELEDRDYYLQKNVFWVPALGNLSVYGQDKSARRKRRFSLPKGARRASTRRRARQSNPTTWHLAATPPCGVAIRGIDFNFGKEPANSFTNDQHPDLRADYVMANPPFNPAERGTNFAWIQHMLHHLAPHGSMALLLANGSMSSGSGGEGDPACICLASRQSFAKGAKKAGTSIYCGS